MFRKRTIGIYFVGFFVFMPFFVESPFVYAAEMWPVADQVTQKRTSGNPIRGVKEFRENIINQFGQTEPIALAIGGIIMEDRWLSVDEIAAHLGIKRDTVYRWIDRYSMPAHRIGRLWKFKKDQVDAWVEAGGTTKDSESKKRN